MAIFTDNYNLKKPEDNDFFDIADMNGNSDIIDNVLMDFEKRLSDNTSNEAIEAIDKSVAIHRLGIMGEKSGVYKNVNMLKALANSVNTYEDFYGLYYILDGLIESQEHIGQFLKGVCQSEDTSFDTLSTIDDVISNALAMDIVISNDKAKKLFYNSKKAMEKASEVSDTVTKILADTYFLEKLKVDERLMNIVYNSNIMAESIGSNEEFLNYIFSDFKIFTDICKYFNLFEKLLNSTTFMQKLGLNVEYYEYVLRNPILTRYLCENYTACNKLISRSNTAVFNNINNNVSLISNALCHANTTKIYGYEYNLMKKILSNMSCLISLCTLGSNMDLHFYQTICLEDYGSVAQECIAKYRGYEPDPEGVTFNGDPEGTHFRSKGILVRLYDWEGLYVYDNFRIYADKEKTKLLREVASKTVIPPTYLYGDFFVDTNGNTTTAFKTQWLVLG